MWNHLFICKYRDGTPVSFSAGTSHMYGWIAGVPRMSNAEGQGPVYNVELSSISSLKLGVRYTYVLGRSLRPWIRSISQEEP